MLKTAAEQGFVEIVEILLKRFKAKTGYIDASKGLG
jgi:hypothetical protein